MPEEFYLALAAGAVTAAGRVDGDAVPARRVKEHDARWNPDAAPGGLEDEVEAASPVMGQLGFAGRRGGKARHPSASAC